MGKIEGKIISNCDASAKKIYDMDFGVISLEYVKTRKYLYWWTRFFSHNFMQCSPI